MLLAQVTPQTTSLQPQEITCSGLKPVNDLMESTKIRYESDQLYYSSYYVIRDMNNNSGDDNDDDDDDDNDDKIRNS